MLARDHGGQQTDHPMQRPSRHIRRLNAQWHRPTVLAPGVAGDARQRKVVDVMPGTVPIRACLTVAGDRHINQLRVDRLQRLVAQPQPRHDTRSKLFEHDVVFSHQLPDHLERLRLLQVQGEAALVAIEVGVAGRRPVIVRRQQLQKVHARRRFDAQHLGPHVGEQQRSERSRQQGGKIENLER